MGVGPASSSLVNIANACVEKNVRKWQMLHYSWRLMDGKCFKENENTAYLTLFYCIQA